MKRIQVITVLVVGLLSIIIFLFVRPSDESENIDTPVEVSEFGEPSEILESTFPDVDFSQSLVPYSKVLSGGVRKDGIPAISNPTFDNLAAVSSRDGQTFGVLLEIDEEKRFYPFNILVSHEIVNDTIGETDFAVTFCPLCGSAIVFNRNVEGEVKEFGVSGFLFESNLIMYDRTETPSLWSQARTEAIIGDQAGQQLEIIRFQQLTLDQVRENHPDALILSENTGFGRSYDSNPYGNYEETESTLFPISIEDRRFPAKEIFYIVPLEDDKSLASRISNLSSGQLFNNSELGLSIEKQQSGEVFVKDNDGEEKPGYYEMWFSWAQHHQENGIVWDTFE